MRYIEKYFILLNVGGIVYTLIELLYRGYSHISMYILGGLCFVFIGLINEAVENMSLLFQTILSDIIVLVLEYSFGYILNIKLKLNIWDYSNLPLNLHGQICLYFALMWIPLCIFGILLDDYLRYKIFHESKPKYHILPKFK